MIYRLGYALNLVMLQLVTATACAATSAADGLVESARLHDWLDAQYEQQLQREPELLSDVGRKVRHAQINDYSEAGLAGKAAAMEQSVAAKEHPFNYHTLSSAGRVSCDFWRYRANVLAQEQQFQRQIYVFDQVSGNHSQFAEFLINFHEVSTPADLTAYIAPVSAIGRAISQLLMRAQHTDTGRQALSYKMGVITILQLRDDSQTRPSQRFDIPRFHDAVLGVGALPLPLLERAVKSWLAAQVS